MPKSIDKSIPDFMFEASLLRELQRENEVLKAANMALKDKLDKHAAVEQELIRTQADLEDAIKAKSTYLAMAGHDLLQPMNAAKLFLSELENTHQVDAAKILIQSLAFSLNNMDALLNSLISISKLNSNGIEHHPESFCINDLLDRLRVEFLLKAESASLNFNCRACSNVWVHSDSQLLLRILRNFLTNAFRYTSKGKVLLGCRRRPEGLEIQVVDNGIGIPDEIKSTMFTAFVRGDGVAVRGDQGLGLGLSIVEKIAELLGHTISYHSVLGRGSIFSVLVPYANPKESNSPHAINQLLSEKPFAGKQVLLLGMNESESASIKQRLCQWGCVVSIEISVKNLPKNITDKFDVCFITDGYFPFLPAHWLQNNASHSIILIADGSAHGLSDQLLEDGFCILPSPVQPLTLRMVMQRVV